MYRGFITQLGRPAPVSVEEIPFLPISFFKNHVVRTGEWTPETVFESSGTTGVVTSRHFVRDPALYKDHALRIFESFYGSITGFHVLALLPSYLERQGSSLVMMADHFIRESQSPHSGFYLNNLDDLSAKLRLLRAGSRKVLVLGVTFALLDLAERFPMDLNHCIIMETGGMKGRRKEIIRDELHEILRNAFNVPEIHSEYGMTELLSQAYSMGAGKFRLPPALKVIIRDINDPARQELPGRTGGINIIDFANIYSCAFVETEDLGRLTQDGYLEVLGRMDNTDVRGCNLLVE